MKTLYIIYDLDFPYIEEPILEAITKIKDKYYLNIASENINLGNRNNIPKLIVNNYLKKFKDIISTFDKVVININ